MPSTDRKKSLQCPNCGAETDENTVRCAYCRSVLTTTACPACFTAVFKGVKFCPNCGAAIVDGKRKSSKKLLCPRCEQLLIDSVIGDTKLHECDHCGGIWLDVPAFNKICADREQQEHILLYKEPNEPAKPQSEVRSKRFYIPCPECGELMNQKNYARVSGVVVDVCKQHGIWFERHELQRIVNFIRSGGLHKAREAEKADIQAEQSRLKAMQSSQSIIHQSLMSDPNEHNDSESRTLIDVLYTVAKGFLR